MNTSTKTGMCRWLAAMLFAMAWNGVALAQGAVADKYPSRPVRIVVPYPSGGGTDAMARVIANHLTAMWGQPVIVDNKAGASGNIGLEAVAKAAPDGYTLVMMPSNHSINPPLFGKLPFDPIADFTPLALVGSSPVMLAVHPSVPARNLKELLALARAKPGSLSYASCGNGTPQHLAGELFKSMAKVDMVHVPYKGCAPAVTDFVGGQVQLAFSTVANLAPFIKAGKVIGIGATAARRSSLVPDLPTLSESGLPGYDVDVWFGLLGPARLPAAIVAKVNADVGKILSTPEIRDKLLSQSFEPLGGTPAQFGALIASDLQRWGTLIRTVGIKVD